MVLFRLLWATLASRRHCTLVVLPPLSGKLGGGETASFRKMDAFQRGQTAAVYSIAVFSGPATYSAIFASWKVGKKMTSLSFSLSRFSARIRGDIAAGPLVRINEIVRAVIKLPRFLMFFGEFCYREVNFFDWTNLDCKLFHYLFEIF